MGFLKFLLWLNIRVLVSSKKISLLNTFLYFSDAAFRGNENFSYEQSFVKSLSVPLIQQLLSSIHYCVVEERLKRSYTCREGGRANFRTQRKAGKADSLGQTSFQEKKIKVFGIVS